MTANPQKYAQEDFSSSYAVGGTIYSLSNYNPDFRIVVVLGEDVYLCESVDLLSGADFDLKEYFNKADLLKKIRFAHDF